MPRWLLPTVYLEHMCLCALSDSVTVVCMCVYPAMGECSSRQAGRPCVRACMCVCACVRVCSQPCPRRSAPGRQSVSNRLIYLHPAS